MNQIARHATVYRARGVSNSTVPEREYASNPFLSKTRLRVRIDCPVLVDSRVSASICTASTIICGCGKLEALVLGTTPQLHPITCHQLGTLLNSPCDPTSCFSEIHKGCAMMAVNDQVGIQLKRSLSNVGLDIGDGYRTSRW